MASSKVERKNFAIKFLYHDCDGCKEMVEKLRKIEGVESIESDPGLEYWTILGTGDPEPITKKLKKNNKKNWVELSGGPTSARNDQKMQTALPEKPVRVIHENPVYALWYGFTDFHRKHDQDEFELKSYTRRFSCDGCKEDGFGPRYRSDRCGSELHVECKFPKPTISHKLFQGSTFKFRRHSKCHGRLCDACGRNINGNSYRCKAKGLDMHPCCSNLKGELRMGETDFTLRDKVLKKCVWCNKKALSGAKTGVPGWSYVSRCNKYHFHVSCITQMVHQAWKKGAIDNIDDTGKALEAMDWKPMASSNRKDGSGGSVNKLLKIVKIIVLPIVATLWGDPTTLVVALGAALFNN